MHLIIDGYSPNIDLMTNKSQIYSFLLEVVVLAGMKPFGQGYCEGFPWSGSEDWSALTCFQPLGESGMVIHTYPERESVFIDLFSCKDFDKDVVIKYIADAFQMKRARIIILERGLDNQEQILLARVISSEDIEFG